ncbi:hypothetical protein [Nitratidesulfovibrio liaohensis]|uniref:Outer membrane protein beta-barrel domain-containing protein n=1 Tax=Nitratidesulfovibrio liaohensis TaxID=2604158 RepID=A0ABY9R6X8_9BACT|nr:hypothetical protein [Nitratidesulfovibrio liaohensis]WMW67189.1 hypothetical protein KPS_001849 [Nitratidesulfovibrio liaohensis]
MSRWFSGVLTRPATGAVLGGPLLILALLLAAPAAHAADNDFSATFTGRTIGQADMDDGGSVAVTEAGASLRYSWFGIDYLNRRYDWSGTASLPFGNGSDPWEQLHMLRLRADIAEQLGFGGLGWFAGAGLTAGWEEEMDDAWGLSGSAGLTWAVGGVRLRGGVAAFAHPVGTRLLPLVAADWGNQRDLGFSATVGFPETMLRYRSSDMFSFRAGGRVEGNTYRLADDSPVQREGYMKTSSVTLGGYIDITPLEDLTLTVGAEYLTRQEMRVYNSDGDERNTYDLDNAPALFLRLSYGF